MFLNARTSYDRDGGQRAEGSFLVLVMPRDPVTPEQIEWARAEKARFDEELKGVESYKGDYQPLFHADYFSQTRAFVRYARMRQSGHFMVGFMDLSHLDIPERDHKFYVSGTYGGDGLQKTVSNKLWERCVPVPRELMEAKNKGGGHNGAGSEGPSIRRWAQENLNQLRRAVRKGT
jgi:hypothetical protein